ncbi:hypothetical protein C8N40_111146 [Pontibacter mucosus]|uniref:Uncharacterized protein n=1 Tax=Pontibacter mucosus TaxID=1649266 RepID=A0A2T5YD88_9BACT|nr:hypothetical protein [Pontibacter mucosus]PTX14481.1 hypothetical protein C8N40_111146 [Pontibacter mucosus]
MEELKCEGACATHGTCTGTVKEVVVRRASENWGSFCYCDTAIATDTANGFSISKEGPKTDRLWGDTLHGFTAKSRSLAGAWMLIRNKCVEQQLRIPTYNQVKEIHDPFQSQP